MNGNTRHTPFLPARCLPFHPVGKPFREVAGKGGTKEDVRGGREEKSRGIWVLAKEWEGERDNPGLKAGGEVVWGQVDVQIKLEAVVGLNG